MEDAAVWYTSYTITTFNHPGLNSTIGSLVCRDCCKQVAGGHVVRPTVAEARCWST